MKEEGKPTGKIFSDEGESLALTHVEIKYNNVLYFEVTPDYNVLKISRTKIPCLL